MDHQICLLVQLLALGLQIHINEGLEKGQIYAIVNENCTRYIKTQCEGVKFTTSCVNNNSYLDLISPFTAPGELMCPPWHQKTGDGKCEAGANFKHTVTFGEHTMQTSLQTFYCMTTSDKNATNVIGSCLYSHIMVTHVAHVYYPLPCNISKLNRYTCAGLNREGQLCGWGMKGLCQLH